MCCPFVIYRKARKNAVAIGPHIFLMVSHPFQMSCAHRMSFIFGLILSPSNFCASQIRLCGDWRRVLLWNTTCSHKDWKRTTGIAGSFRVCSLDDSSHLAICQIFAVESAIHLRPAAVNAWHLARVLCLVVPLAGTPISNSRLRTMELELETEETILATFFVGFDSGKWFAHCSYKKNGVESAFFGCGSFRNSSMECFIQVLITLAGALLFTLVLGAPLLNQRDVSILKKYKSGNCYFMMISEENRCKICQNLKVAVFTSSLGGHFSRYFLGTADGLPMHPWNTGCWQCFIGGCCSLVQWINMVYSYRHVTACYVRYSQCTQLVFRTNSTTVPVH